MGRGRRERTGRAVRSASLGRCVNKVACIFLGPCLGLATRRMYFAPAFCAEIPPARNYRVAVQVSRASSRLQTRARALCKSRARLERRVGTAKPAGCCRGKSLINTAPETFGPVDTSENSESSVASQIPVTCAGRALRCPLLSQPASVQRAKKSESIMSAMRWEQSNTKYENTDIE